MVALASALEWNREAIDWYIWMALSREREPSGNASSSSSTMTTIRGRCWWTRPAGAADDTASWDVLGASVDPPTGGLRCEVALS